MHQLSLFINLFCTFGVLTLLPYAQEEERERRMDYVPEESAVNTEIIEACFHPFQ